jgi:endonuclease/exonuclease/phosphatase family metal-dependent hydrolase
MLNLSRELLVDFNEVSANKRVSEHDDFYQATFVRKRFDIVSSDILFEGDNELGLAVSVEIRLPNTDVHILNFHGRSRPVEKLDTPDRIRGSQALIDFFANKIGLKIIGGDFNILPDARSIGMFREQGYLDLIKDYGIATTRNRLVWDRYPDDKWYYSDYVFVDDKVRVKQFTVPSDEVSDHLAMILEIDGAA